MKKQKNHSLLLFLLIAFLLAGSFVFIILIRQDVRFDLQAALFPRKVSRTATTTLELHGSTAIKDTYIYRWSDGNDNYSSKTNLMARRRKDSAVFLQFSPSITSTTTVQSATLSLTASSVEDSQDPATFTLYRILPEFSWNISTLRWIDVDKNYDGTFSGSEIFFDSTPVATVQFSKVSVGQVVIFDIKNLVQSWASGTANNGIVIFNEADDGQVDFYSSEYAETSKQPFVQMTVKTSSKGSQDADGDGVTNGDCNNYDATVYPGALEICEDGKDQDCDGQDQECQISPSSENDRDGDGVLDESDNCPDIANPTQADGNHNGIGDFCDSTDQDVLSSNDWAYVSYEALKKYKDLVYFWKARVAPNSEDFFNAGGGWNDDVELAASLTGYWLLTGDESVANDIFRKMADSIQEQPYVGSKGTPWVQPADHRIEQGFGTVMLDVEHSAEETTLVFPKMTYIDYGEPRNIELMTRTLWNFQDNVPQSGYTEENWAVSVGQNTMLMRSPRYNARNIDFSWVIPEPDKTIEPQDVIENFKTTFPSLSLGWYYGSSHPLWQDSGFMKQHHNTWIAATKLSLPSQGGVAAKPAEIPPSKILLTSKPDSGQWNLGDWQKNQSDPEGYDAGWANGAYVFRHFYQALIGDWMILNGSGSFAQDASNLVEEAFHYRQNAMQVAGNNISLDRQFMQWRAEVANAPDDQLFLDTRKWKDSDTRITAYNIYLDRYKTSRQLSDFTTAMTLAWDAFNHMLSTLNGNFDDWTNGAVTAGVTDDVKFEESDSWTMAALGGSGIYDGAYPTMYMSLNQQENHIVTLVNEKSPSKISFWAYNFGGSAEELGVQMWRLSDGSGRLTIARDSNKDGQADYTLETLDVADTGRGQKVTFTLPHKKMYLVTLDVTSPRTKNLDGVADPAIGRRDFRYENGKVLVDVHNIGIGQAQNVTVKLSSITGVLLGQTTLSLSGFTTMNPVISMVTFDVTGKISSPDELGSVVLEYSGEEITKLNNTLKL